MRNIKVLVADDESTVRQFIKLVVSKEKLPVAAVAEVDNGADAVKLAAEFLPDLVFLDIRMPGLDGLKAAEMILAKDHKPTVVIVSAYNEFDYARTAFRSGVADFLLKPIKPADVADLINAVAARCVETDAAIACDKKKRSAVISAVNDYVTANLDKPIHLNDIAKAIYVSSYHLSRTFKLLTGQSIVDYIQEQRLAKAMELLKATDFSITDIAGKVGFNDAAYFATCFKNKTGVSPMQYRKMQDIESK